MTRTPFAHSMASSASNPYGNSPTAKLEHVYASSAAHSGAGSVGGGGGSQQQHMNKSLAHSTSLLANDGYITGMSSDSELTSATRHHHRPHSSQSRVYHAHPAPRSPHTSSRLSHYSDSAASYAAQAKPPAGMLASGNHLPHLSHQASVSSSGSGGSGSSAAAATAYLGLTDSPLSPLLQQQHAAALSGHSSGGRKLPQRPFKQSMSIDHHSIGAHKYQHQHQPHSLSHLNSPAHSMSPYYESAEPAGQFQQQPFGFGQRLSGPQPIEARFAQRNFRLEMELMEKQAAGLHLYDSEPGLGNPAAVAGAGLPPTARPGSATARQLPPVNPDQLHYSAESYLGSDVQHQQQNHLHRQELFAAHLASAADWPPSVGLAGHSLARPGIGPQFKQAMSIDHYPSHELHQQQQQHYSPARAQPYATAGDHYRGSLGYAASSPAGGFDSPTRHQPAYRSSNSDLHQNELGYQQQQPQSAPYQGQQEFYQPSHDSGQRGSFSSSFSQTSGASRAAVNQPQQQQQQQQQQRPKLQHQVSSSSSNSQSGSLKSSNIDINKSLVDHQKTGPLSLLQQAHKQSPQHKTAGAQSEQQRHGLLRKGYTSAVSGGLGNSITALNELASSGSGEPSAGYQATSHGGPIHLGSYGAGNRPPLRAASPSAALEATSASGQLNQHRHSGSSKDAVGTRSESSTGLPNGASNNSSLTKKSNSATQLSMTGTKKRLGFRKKQVTSFSVHRSEEVAPLEARHLVKQGSSVSEGDSSMSGDSSSRSWSNSNFKQPTPDELASMSFIDGLGGSDTGEKSTIQNKQDIAAKCLAKAKTTLSNKRTLDPLFQQQLTFHEDYHGSILQSIIWGNFGKMDKKNFMGIAQISIDDLELSDTVISWYKLFLPSSLQTLPSKSLRHTLLSNSTESFTNTNNS